MRTALILFTSLLLISCGPDVTKHYAIKADAGADAMFEKGWLPELIPNSAKEIKIENNLDLNTSSGIFKFEPSDWSKFERSVNMKLKSVSPFSRWSETQADFKARGYHQLAHSEDTSTWVFFCQPIIGTCEYFTWGR